MTEIENNPIEAAYDEVFKEEPTEIVEKAEEEIEEVEDNAEEVTEEIETEETTDESIEEVEEENETEEEEINLTETLRGAFSKEHIDLLESIEDPKLRNNLIIAGKKQRADLDRKRLELGETKKLVEIIDNEVKANNLNYTKQQYGDMVKNFMGFEALYSRDPKQAIESLAKSAKIDLSTYGTVQEDDDYRTPEEIAIDSRLKRLEEENNQFRNQHKQQEQVSVQQEINNFANLKDSEGNLEHPHFDKVRSTMSVLMTDLNLDMDGAYKKAIRLDDDLFEQEKRSLLTKDTTRRKQEVEKAKKLKRQSISSSNVKSSSQDPRKALGDLVEHFGFA